MVVLLIVDVTGLVAALGCEVTGWPVCRSRQGRHAG